jgi:hypothetical protein
VGVGTQDDVLVGGAAPLACSARIAVFQNV